MAIILPVQNDIVTEFLLLSDQLHKSVLNGHCAPTVNGLCKQGAKRLFRDCDVPFTTDGSINGLVFRDFDTRLWYFFCPEIDFCLYHYTSKNALLKEVWQRLA